MRKSIKIFFLFLISCFLLLVFCCFFFWKGIYLPKDFEISEFFEFEIKKGEGVFTVSERLEKQGLIKDKLFFQIFLVLKGKTASLQPGIYYLSPSMNVPYISQKLCQGGILDFKITIPEGYIINQIERKINEVLNEKYYKALNIREEKVLNYKKDFPFLENVPDDFDLEGFLFPDTYSFNLNVKEKELIEIFLANFGKKLNSELKQEIEKKERTIFEIIIMASLLEKEVRTIEDKKIVSGILWKRLENNFPLQVDATITYLTGKKTTKITKQETEIDSPYNTYKYLGLPYGPICNPGIESIEAAVYPKESNFWFYLSTLEGETIFSRTLEEHNIAKAKYLD